VFERIWVVFAKEVVDNLRDRRSVATAMLYPFIGPLLVGVLIGLVGGAVRELPTRTLDLPVLGAERAPALVEYLESHGARVVSAPSDPARAVRAGESEAVVIIGKDYAERFANQRPAPIEVVSDGSRLSAVMATTRAMTLLQEYAQSVAAARLGARGVDTRVIQPIALDTVDVAVGRSLTGFFLNMMPPFIIFTIFIGGVYLAIDATTGERERGSLEPLLANPVTRLELMSGKVAAAFVFTAASLAVQLIAFRGVFTLLTRGDASAIAGPDGVAFVAVFLIAVPLMLLAVALQVIIAALTSSFKEAQTYLALLPLVPALPGLVLVFVSFRAHEWMLAIPTFGQTLLFGQIVRGETVRLLDIATASAATSLVAGASLLVAARLYRRERLLFGS